jgi:predicted acylesterase/phospholipase RssA
MVKKRYIVLKLFFSLALLLSLGSSTLHAEPEKIDFSIVISGGVSLGAYESGYNWAIVKMLSKIREHGTLGHPELRSVTGASAGSINALMTAMYWCQKDSVPLKNAVEDNLFYETWVNLGIEDLAIHGEDSNNKSTLFTRKALEKKAAYILEQMNRPIFRKGCEVPLGVSVTKVTPIIETIAGIKIKNQHFSVPLTVKEKNGRLVIENRKMPTSTDFYISIPGIEKDTGKIANVLFASSAFPGAFQQVKLEYIYKGKKASHYFIDGGAFDNVPLQLAIELNEKASLFLFMDPSNMRKEPKKSKSEEEEEKPPVGFITTNAIPLLSSLEIFQSMRLHQAINKYFRNNDKRKLILSSRYHPITGKYLEHFAAFLDKNFRVYDYYVGVYDAIFHLATSLRKKPQYRHFSQTQLMDILKSKLSLDKNSEAFAAYTMLRDIEFKHIRPKTTDRFSAIYNAFNVKKRDEKRYDIDEFKKFLTKLDISYLDISNDKSPFLVYVKKDVNNWYRRPFRAIINRVTTLENDRAKIYKEHLSFAKMTTLSAWVASTYVAEKDGWDILPLHVPEDEGKAGFRTALRLLPGEIATDMKNGGVSFGYTALYYANFEYLSGFEAKAAYVIGDRTSDFVRVDLDAFYEYDDFFKVGLGGSVFGDMEGDFYKKESAYGVNTYLDFMDIFRFTYVHRAGELDKKDYIYFGIENLPSLIYWMNR